MKISSTGLAISSILALSACIETPIRGQDALPDVIPNPATPAELWQTDTYVQVQEPKVDVLWVVDNSGSMLDEQTAIAADFPIFFDYFLNSNLDYHIGVVSTDMDDPNQSGKLVEAAGVRWITPDTPDPTDVFAAMSELGTGGSGNEEGILAGYAAFELQDDYNAGFLRDDSSVNIIVVSDEGDFSPEQPVTLTEYEQYLNGLRTDPDMVTYNGIVSPVAPEFPCDGAQTPGSRYIDVINAVGGVFWSRCNPDWPAALEQMGLTAAGLKREYFLTQVPVVETIGVSVETLGFTQTFQAYDPQSGTGEWTYSSDRNSVTFLSFVPDPGSTVEIHYEVLSANEHED